MDELTKEEKRFLLIFPSGIICLTIISYFLAMLIDYLFLSETQIDGTFFPLVIVVFELPWILYNGFKIPGVSST